MGGAVGSAAAGFVVPLLQLRKRLSPTTPGVVKYIKPVGRPVGKDQSRHEFLFHARWSSKQEQDTSAALNV